MFRGSDQKVVHPLLAAAGQGVISIAFAPLRLSLDGWRGEVKRAIDILIALLLLGVLALPMLLVALAIRIDSPGDVLFRQRRVGFGNVCFEMLKFRTMHDHPPETGWLRQTTPNDPRVTRVGALLRRTSFDELPQLFNVLRGDMSVVGPRPHAPGSCAGGKPFELVTWRIEPAIACGQA